MLIPVRTRMIVLCVALLAWATPGFAGDSIGEKNKQIVLDYVRLMIEEHDPVEAFGKYMSDSVIEHNPNDSDDVDLQIEYWKKFFKENPDVKVEIKRVIVEGSLVALHSHWKITPGTRGEAVMDIFRLENGKIVEHWDVIQEVPENPVNQNSMF